jgi:GAF domain-containing protein
MTFCQHAVRSGEPFLVEDARVHPLVSDNPAVAAGVVSYAGVPLVLGGTAVGALCVIDSQPRNWSTEEVSTLRALARSTMRLLEERGQARTLGHKSASTENEHLLPLARKHLKALDRYDALISSELPNLAEEASARNEVVSSFAELEAVSAKFTSGEDQELSSVVNTYMKAECARNEASRSFTEGEATLSELEHLIVRYDDALSAFRLAVLDRGD